MDPSRQPVSFIATDRPEESKGFYRDIVGLELIDATPFALVFRDGSHVLRIQIVPDFEPVGYTVHGWQVENIAEDIRALAAAGVTFERFGQLDQDALGIWTTPDGPKIAWFKDPCGNVLSLTEHA